MSSVLNRTTKLYLLSVNTPDYPETDWVINPDLSAVLSIPVKYWKIEGDIVSEMNQSEKNAVDLALLPAAKVEKKLQLREDTDNLLKDQGYDQKICDILTTMYSDGNRLKPNRATYIQPWIEWIAQVENELKSKQTLVTDATALADLDTIAISTTTLIESDPQKTVSGSLTVSDATSLSTFLNANAEVTDPDTGIKGPFYLMQELQHRKDLYNDSTNPLYTPGHTPILGTSGILVDHANRISIEENIHSKLGWHNQEVIKATYKKPKDLLIYYGYPNSFNSGLNGWDNEKVAIDMAKCQLIVLGNGVQDPGHGDYANTQVIIPRIKALNPSANIFGYVSANQTLSNFQIKVNQWNTLQVQGIFIDEVGYDFGINRSDFNTRVDYVHGKTYSKICFANAWNTDHILGTANDVSYPNTTFNASLTASNLNTSDWILLESFPINTTAYSGTSGYESKSDWAVRGSKAIALRATYGVNFASAGIINNDNVNGQALFNFLFTSSLMWSLEASGSSDTNYGSGATVTFWTRPDEKQIGHIWTLNASVQVSSSDADVYYRYTEFGRLLLDFSSGAQLSSITYW